MSREHLNELNQSGQTDRIARPKTRQDYFLRPMSFKDTLLGLRRRNSLRIRHSGNPVLARLVASDARCFFTAGALLARFSGQREQLRTKQSTPAIRREVMPLKKLPPKSLISAGDFQADARHELHAQLLGTLVELTTTRSR